MEPDFSLSLKDLWTFVKRSQKGIVVTALLFATLGAFFTLSRPILYTSEATFREKESSRGSISGSLSEFLLNAGRSAQIDEAISIFKSRKLLAPLIEEIGMQAVLERKNAPKSLFSRLRDNLRLQLAYFRHEQKALFSDQQTPLKIEKVSYRGEAPLSLELEVHGDLSIEVFERIGSNFLSPLGTTKLGDSLKGENFELTFTADTLFPDRYSLTLLPIASVAKSLKKAIKLETDEDDRNLLTIQYRSPDRHFGALFVNRLMEHYRLYLQDEVDRRSSLQFNYLSKRQKEIGSQFEALLSQHADHSVKDLGQYGLANSETAIEYLVNSQKRCQDRLRDIDLELLRLKRLAEEDFPRHEQFLSDREPGMIRAAAHQIRELVQRCNALEKVLATQAPVKSGTDPVQLQLEQLNEVQASRQEAEDLLKEVKLLGTSVNPKHFPRLMGPTFVVKSWLEKLKYPEHSDHRPHFIAYLENLTHLLQVQEETLKERIAHHKAPINEYYGMSLETANDLYLGTSASLSEVQQDIKTLNFQLQQLQDPDFEISSLSTSIEDPIAQKMIARSSDVVLLLHDHANRGAKEKERLRQDLELNQKFLTTHMQQSSQLLGLREHLLEEKVARLQQVVLDLSRDRIRILQRQLADYVQEQIVQLKEEKSLTQFHYDELRNRSAQIPSRWVSEEKVNFSIRMGEKLVEEVTRIVENANISQNLEVIQSAPLDESIATVLPDKPPLVPFTFLGAILGVFLSLAVTLTKEVMKGTPASSQNLEKLGCVCVPVSKRPGPDQLRRVLAKVSGSTHLVPKHLAEGIASHLERKGHTPLVIQLNTGSYKLSKTPGLAHWLEEEIDALPIEKGLLPSGGQLPYLSEQLSAKDFSSQLRKIQGYDRILLATNAKPKSSTFADLATFADSCLVSLTDERIEELSLLLETREKMVFLI